MQNSEQLEGQVETQEFKEGLTRRSLLAILFTVITLTPACTWLILSIGTTVGPGVYMAWFMAPFTCLVLASWLASTFGSPLTKQEIFIIWVTSELVGVNFAFVPLYALYYRMESPVWMFVDPISKKPLPLVIPFWFAPPLGSPVAQLRTFWHSDWILPIALYLIPVLIADKITGVALGYLFYQLYVKEEKLEFPMQTATAETCIAMSERDPDRTRVLILFAVTSLIYTFITYGVQFISGVKTVPIPWADFNLTLEKIFPGASFGLSLDPIIFAVGLVLPLNVSIQMFIASFLFYFIGNWLMVKLDIFTEWTSGMNLAHCYTRSVIWIWFNFFIGLATAVTITTLIQRPRTIVRAFKSLRKLPDVTKRAGILPLWVLLLMYFISTLAFVAIAHTLVPNFPVWILLFYSVGWTFVEALIAARALGVSGFPISIPYIREGILTASGYRGVDIWYTPLSPAAVWPSGGWWCSFFKMAEMTQTKLTSVVKANILITFAVIFFNFFYMDMFWSMARIPSAVYPWTMVSWPVSSVLDALWVTRQFTVFRTTWIATSCIIGTTVSLLFTYAHLPFSLISFVAGSMTPIPLTFTTLLGGIACKLLSKHIGKFRGVAVGGIAMGEGIALSISAAIALLINARWILLY